MRYPLLVLALALLPAPLASADNPVEVGAVRWSRDLDAALQASRETGRPVFLLFQEVPGCSGCQDFGKTVLTQPLLVEAIEDEFVPVLVHNNKPGKDEEILKRFEEPAWNYQVVRFLDDDAEDLIPRKDRVWTTGALAVRMTEALRAAKRPVPKYLRAIAAEHDASNHATCAFAQSCYWVGEMSLGGIDGVITTEAGWLDGHEVTRVVYDRKALSLETLAEKARHARCAQKVYAADEEASRLEDFVTGALGPGYTKARASDQKKQIESWTAVRELPGITAMQLTKVNALAPLDRAKAIEWLSPRQRKALSRVEQTAAPASSSEAPGSAQR